MKKILMSFIYKFLKKILNWFGRKNKNMNDLENYARLIDGIFGTGTATFKTDSTATNHVIGALNSADDFVTFKANFQARLERLKRIYSAEPDYLKEIITQINCISGESNWRGAFAELATYDHFNQDILARKTYIHRPIQPNVTFPVTETLGSDLGKTESNLDGFVEDCSLYFDVKVFKDNVKEILEGIFAEVCKNLGITGLHIKAEYSLHLSFEDFQLNRRRLVDELQANINVAARTKHITSKIILGLRYRLLWGQGLIATEHEYDPYSHAENFQTMLFEYTDKFVRDSRSMIVLVVFPWYNQIVRGFRGGNVALFRALARRTFCQFRYDATPFQHLNSTFAGTESIFEVSRYLSGIVFLEDNTILSETPNSTNVKSYVYLNPNAKNPIPRSLSGSFLRGLHNTAYDDFEHDNY